MESASTSTVTALLLGPGGALVLMVLGGRWLMARLEKADEERKAAAARMETLVGDNTRAMLTMGHALESLAGKVEALKNGCNHREVTDPGRLGATG